MERASSAAYTGPCRKIAKPSVARAIEGAAPNNPAKLLGLNRSPIRANVETRVPPIRKRKRSSFHIFRLHHLYQLASRPEKVTLSKVALYGYLGHNSPHKSDVGTAKARLGRLDRLFTTHG